MSDYPAQSRHLEVVQVVYLVHQPLLAECLVSEVELEDVPPPVTPAVLQGPGLELLQSEEEVVVRGGGGEREQAAEEESSDSHPCHSPTVYFLLVFLILFTTDC